MTRAVPPVRRAAIALGLAGILSAPPAAHPERVAGWGREYAFAPDGLLTTRHLLGSAGTIPGDPAGPAFFPPPPPADTLWTDRVHQNSIPERVAISGNGEAAFAGWWLNVPRASHYVISNGRVPNWYQDLVTNGLVPVSTTFSGNLFCTTGELDSLYGLNSIGGEFYSIRYPPVFLGKLVATCDSGTVVVGTAERSDSTRVTGRNAVTGDSLWARMLDEPVNGLDLSSDGSTAVVTTDYRIYVFSGLSGAPIDTLIVPEGCPWPAAVSGDGTRIVAGGATPLVRLWQWAGAGPRYDALWFSNTGSTDVTSVDISDDGSRILAGTYIDGPPTAGKLLVYNPASPTPLFTVTTFGDNVCDVSLDSDGEFGAAACWGRQGGTVGAIFTVFQTSAPASPLYTLLDDQISVIRSVLDVEISDDGRRVVAGAKQVHARELGNRGVVIAVDNPAGYTGVPPTPSPVHASNLTLEAWPNPTPAGARFAWRAPAAGGPYRLRILDVTGRELGDFALDGLHELAWDGRDAAGEPLPAGLYLYRLEGARAALTRKLVIAR